MEVVEHLIVGAGPAGLACAIRLGQLLEQDPETAERLGEVPVAVVEKGKQPGSHLLSGAVVNPRGLRRLFNGSKRFDDMPHYDEVMHESVYFLSDKRAYRILTPQGTIGVRGTVFDMSIRNGKTRILLLSGHH